MSVVTYGMGVHADFRASNYRMEFGGTSYQLDARGKSYLVRVPLIGRFNVANSMAALAAANALGINLRDAVLSLAQITAGAGPFGIGAGQTAVPGLCRLRAYARRVAQRPQNLARTRAAPIDRRLRLRRRSRPAEAPTHGRSRRSKCRLRHHHLRQSAQGRSGRDHRRDRKRFSLDRYEKITDRAKAIARAIELAQPRDIVLIAGKGHETYQEFADHTIPFDDIQVARRAIEDHPMEF